VRKLLDSSGHLGPALEAPVQINQAEQFLTFLLAPPVPASWLRRSIKDHPWAWIALPSDFAGEAHIEKLLKSFVAMIRKVERCREDLVISVF
jgi:hypothetical protein